MSYKQRLYRFKTRPCRHHLEELRKERVPCYTLLRKGKGRRERNDITVDEEKHCELWGKGGGSGERNNVLREEREESWRGAAIRKTTTCLLR